MATKQSAKTDPPFRSASEIPVRTAGSTREYAALTTRLPLLDTRPDAPGDYTPKAFAGEVVPFSVVSFREGHDLIGVQVRLVDPEGDVSLHRLHPLNDGTDRWTANIQPLAEGDWGFRFEAFADDFATWAHAAEVKIAAGVDVQLMKDTGAVLFERAARDADRPKAEATKLKRAATSLRKSSDAAAIKTATDPALAELFWHRPVLDAQTLFSVSEPNRLRVEPERAGVAAWYEFFPRSEGAKKFKNGTVKTGTFRTAIKSLDRVADGGYDVIYLPPIHPIGEVNRKGPNNTLVTSPGDPGSPWAIGSAAGGHDTVHPDLGTLKDFQAFVRAANKHGLDVALDLALQAAPDHPWVEAHPEWFTTLPDGSIAYAENPPKKYQDIYPLNFDNDPEGIFAEMLRVVRFWIHQGVKTFRVDNPHTKPTQFWERLIGDINAEYPEVIFLAEAFTRPAVVLTLAAAGFQQSYSYFTWRNTKAELEEFFTWVSTETADFMRPNVFMTTPDILHAYLSDGGRPAHRIRAAIAATASPLYGTYAGYELNEHIQRPGAEEHIDSEKYEYKVRDFAGAVADGSSIAPELALLNDIRRAHPALRQLRNFTLHTSNSDDIFVFSKHIDAAFTADGTADTIIVVINLNPHEAREANVYLDQTAWGSEPGARFAVHELLTGDTYEWGDDNYVRLDPQHYPMHILHVQNPKDAS